MPTIKTVRLAEDRLLSILQIGIIIFTTLHLQQGNNVYGVVDMYAEFQQPSFTLHEGLPPGHSMFSDPTGYYSHSYIIQGILGNTDAVLIPADRNAALLSHTMGESSCGIGPHGTLEDSLLYPGL